LTALPAADRPTQLCAVRPSPSLTLVLALALPLVLAACGDGETAPPTLGPTTTTVSFAAGTLTAEIASTRITRETGLMNRPSLGANNGMLFVYATDQPVGPLAPGFWMKNTLINLSIAFLDSTRRVLDVQEMTAGDTTTYHRPGVPYRYALEANQGWFASHGVAAGALAAFTLPAGTVIDP